MEPKNFKNANVTLAKPADINDEECGSLHVFTDGKVCISLWKMRWSERLSALFFGNLWVFVHSGYTQPPVAAMVCREIFGKKKRQ
jgi:hypothetical protein